MGTYLSNPCVEKKSDDFTDSPKFCYGVSAMQGWRITMEDAHCCMPSLEDNTSLFGVYDGHGGSEVAIYCALHFSDVLKASKLYQEGNYEEALKETFMKIDKTLREPDAIKELKVLADRDPEDGPPTEADFQNKEDEENCDEDEAKLLCEEATMSIEELLERYGKAANETKANLQKIKEESQSLKDSSEENVPVESSSSATEENKSSSSSSSSENLPKRTSNTSQNAKQLQPATSSSMNGPVQKSESPQPSEGTITKPTSSIESSKVIESKSSSSSDNAEEALASLKNEDGEDTKKAQGDVVEDDKKTVKKTTEKIKPQGKVPASKIHPKKLAALVSDEDIEDEEDESDSEDDEDGFDSDEAVEGSDSEEESSDEDEEEEGDIDISELPMTTPASAVEEPGKDSGTTAVIAFLRGRDLHVANAGDSRCVLSRSGKAVALSEDHKPEDETEIKRISAAGGHVNFQGRVNGGLNLSRAIGDHCYKANSELKLEDQMITAMPDVMTTKLQPGDEFMVLACDGIWNVFSSQEVVDFVRARLPTPDSAKTDMKLSSVCEELFDLCLAPDTMGDGTGCDNMTCVLIRFNQEWLEKCETENPTPTEEKFLVTGAEKPKQEVTNEKERLNDGAEDQDGDSKTTDGEEVDSELSKVEVEKPVKGGISKAKVNSVAEDDKLKNAAKRPRTENENNDVKSKDVSDNPLESASKRQKVEI